MAVGNCQSPESKGILATPAVAPKMPTSRPWGHCRRSHLVPATATYRQRALWAEVSCRLGLGGSQPVTWLSRTACGHTQVRNGCVGLCSFSGLEEPNKQLWAPSSMHGGPCRAGWNTCLFAKPTRSDLVSKAPEGAPAPSCAEPEGERPQMFSLCLSLFFNVCLFLREGERDSGHGAEGEGARGSVLTAASPTLGSNSPTVRSRPEPKSDA